jgi:hypothetical protein
LRSKSAMNNKGIQTIWDDMICDTLREANPQKVLEIKKLSKDLGYDSIIQYLLSAHDLYKGLISETSKGTVLGLVVKDRATLEKLITSIENKGILIRFKSKGLDYANKANGTNKTNGNQPQEYTGK